MGLTRQLKRNMAKAAYKKFADEWRKERAYQRWTLDSGQTIPEGTPLLKRKPTFSQWAVMVKTRAAQLTASPADVQEFKDKDLEWEEQETPRKEEAPTG